jgi:LmbE family N-acetylglucosaminyl deacetylase
MNIVSIMAHQDDEMRCLGTMLKCRERGDRLHFITVTDGSKGMVQQPELSREAAAAIRDAEMRALATAADAGYINLGYPDEFLFDAPEVRMRLIDAIRQTRADVIFTHYTEDYNADHTTVSALVRHCAMQACLPVLPTESAPLAAHPAIFMVEPHGPFVFPASHYVDITAHHDAKIHLLLNHASQEEALQLGTGSGLAAMTRTLDAFRGDQVAVPYAEAFVPMRARGAIKGFSVLP